MMLFVHICSFLGGLKLEICKKCGYRMSEDAIFCPMCGTKTSKSKLGFDEKVATKSYNFNKTKPNSNDEKSQKLISEKENSDKARKEVYQGEVRKCPNCGEVLGSFETKCSSCGYEIRNISANQSVKELSELIQQLELKRTKKNKEQINEQIANTIKSFPIPNTKEDIIEFMILASSNIESNDVGSESDVSKAWFAKTSQAYIKAKTILSEEDFNKVKSIYVESKNLLQQKEKENNLKLIKGVIIGIGSFVLGITLIVVFCATVSNCRSPEKNRQEEIRLETIVSDANDALTNREYKQALRIADSMKYNGYDKERERWWGIEKERLIDEIINESHKAGIELERPTVEETTSFINKYKGD